LPFHNRETASLFIALIMGVFLSGCGGSQEDESPAPELTFRINSALLGERFVDPALEFSFQPPKGCAPMPKASLDKARGKIVEEFSLDGSFAVSPRAIFIDPKERLICLVSTFAKLPPASELTKSYKQAIARQVKRYEVKHGTYVHGGLEVRQILILGAEKVNFKLIILRSDQNSFQIDYSLSRLSYEKKLEAIESSLGSIKKL
jgi:hypothetical protein